MNRLMQLLQSGRHAVLINPDFETPTMVDYLGELGFESVMLDCEHGTLSVEGVMNLARAARAAGMSSIVRPEYLHRAIITRYLDCRVDGIMVPLVQDAATAREIVDIVRYARPDDHGEVMIIAMIESAQAIANLPEILQVEGISAFFVARGDLSKSLGFPDQKNHPAVLAALDGAIAQIRAAGKVVAAAGEWDTVGATVDKGVQLLYIHANTLLKKSAGMYRNNARL